MGSAGVPPATAGVPRPRLLSSREASEFEISLRLKRVAMWATQLSSRTLFEWVWDGKAIYKVQADLEETASGVNPHSLLPAQIDSIELASLQLFHPANQQDYERYAKLRNVSTHCTATKPTNNNGTQ